MIKLKYATLCLILLSCVSKQQTSNTKLLPHVAMADLSIYESEIYNNIMRHYDSQGLSYVVDRQKLDLESPIKSEIGILTRFGTPTLMKMQFDENTSSTGYYHDGLDIAEFNPGELPAKVFAPVSGKAKVIYQVADDQISNQPDYDISIFIHDNASQAFVGLLHIKPHQKFLTQNGLIDVKKGDEIGELARVEGSFPDLPKFRHLHLMLWDLNTMERIDPSRYIRGYHDTQKPVVKDVILYDEQANRIDKLINGKLDIVINAFDIDNHSIYNQEIAKIAATIRDQNDNILLELPECALSDTWFSKNFASRTPFHELNVFPIIQTLEDGDGPESVNVGRSNMYFEYALTHYKVTNSKCSVSSNDQDAYIEINDKIKMISVEGSVWDHFGNKEDFKKILQK